MKILKIDSIMFYVKDLNKSAKFYEGIFGLVKAWEDKNYKMIGFKFQDSDSEIVIHNDKSIPNPDINFLVENVERFCKEFERLGYKVVKGPVEVRPGKFATVQDIDGNLINIIDLTRFGNKPKYD